MALTISVLSVKIPAFQFSPEKIRRNLFCQLGQTADRLAKYGLQFCQPRGSGKFFHFS